MPTDRPYSTGPFDNAPRLDLYLNGTTQALVELTRLRATVLYKNTEQFYNKARFTYDPNEGTVGWWNAKTGLWEEIWAAKLVSEGSLQRWSYFPENGHNIKPKQLPSTVDTSEIPYFVLKRLAFHAETRS